MASQTKDEVYLIGPSQITIGGVNVGYTEDASLELEVTDVQANVAKYGDTPLKVWHLATKARLKFTIHQINYEIYAKVFQGSTHLTDGSNDALAFGKVAGVALTGEEVILTPEQSATLGDIGKLILWKCVPREARAINWNKEHQMVEVTLEALVQEGKNDGERLGRFGNASVAADTSAPTVSLADPADDSAAHPVGDPIAITWDGSMNTGTLTADNVVLFTAAEASVQTPVAGSITYVESTKIMTFTPSANLSAATEYEFIMTTGIEDISGNAFAGAKYSFTTA